MQYFIIVLMFLSGNVFAGSGTASYYHDKFQGRKTASGEVFSQRRFTAAHRSLPFGTKIQVTNVSNGKTVIVEVNDRGPFVKGRVVDLSKAAAGSIGLDNKSGVCKVKYKVL